MRSQVLRYYYYPIAIFGQGDLHSNALVLSPHGDVSVHVLHVGTSLAVDDSLVKPAGFYSQQHFTGGKMRTVFCCISVVVTVASIISRSGESAKLSQRIVTFLFEIMRQVRRGCRLAMADSALRAPDHNNNIIVNKFVLFYRHQNHIFV